PELRRVVRGAQEDACVEPHEDECHNPQRPPRSRGLSLSHSGECLSVGGGSAWLGTPWRFGRLVDALLLVPRLFVPLPVVRRLVVGRLVVGRLDRRLDGWVTRGDDAAD